MFQLRVLGHPDDMKDENKKETKTVKNNGFNPTWDEAFHFSIKVPDLAILELKVVLKFVYSP